MNIKNKINKLHNTFKNNTLGEKNKGKKSNKKNADCRKYDKVRPKLKLLYRNKYSVNDIFIYEKV